jgi:hypothetical protein
MTKRLLPETFFAGLPTASDHELRESLDFWLGQKRRCLDPALFDPDQIIARLQAELARRSMSRARALGDHTPPDDLPQLIEQ